MMPTADRTKGSANVNFFLLNVHHNDAYYTKMLPALQLSVKDKEVRELEGAEAEKPLPNSAWPRCELRERIYPNSPPAQTDEHQTQE